jgi:hypothetical protein
MYHQTTNLTPHELSSAYRMTTSQDEQIYALLLRGGEWDCWTVNDVFPEMLICSVRRALNTLTNENKISRIRERPGRRGKPVGVYKALPQLKLL